jgi:hypothetical protein
MVNLDLAILIGKMTNEMNNYFTNYLRMDNGPFDWVNFMPKMKIIFWIITILINK